MSAGSLQGSAQALIQHFLGYYPRLIFLIGSLLYYSFNEALLHKQHSEHLKMLS